MPELPEVETMVRGIRSTLEGARLVGLKPGDCHCKPILMQPLLQEMQERSRNQIIRQVTRRAKRIVLTLEDQSAFVIEPRMTGLMLVSDPPDEAHLRLEWMVSRQRRRQSVWFWDRRGLGTVRLLTPEEQLQTLGPARLGPDALEMTGDDWFSRLQAVRRPVKVALLDQKLVAGIGNLYASEILHRAGIHPGTSSETLSRAHVTRLHAATQEILLAAIEHEGSTLGDGTYRNVLNQDGSYQNQHRVYAKEGGACRTCSRGTILRIVQAQRSTFYCPHCQKPPRKSIRKVTPPSARKSSGD